jgi:membrane-associated phospholipid phosphatase
MRKFLSQLFKNLLWIFSIRNLPWHLLAIGLTFVIVQTGFDWKFFTHVVNLSWRMGFLPALMLGGLLPLLVPVVLFAVAFAFKNKRTLTIGLAQAQAAILGSFVSSFYKAFTGRIQPPVHFSGGTIDVASLVDNSHRFQFGFWRHGIFWGWPSSHTTLAFAMASAIWVLFPKNKLVRFLALVYAFYVGIGVGVTAIHWLSEFVAGAIFGTLVGVTVGKSYFDSHRSVK